MADAYTGARDYGAAAGGGAQWTASLPAASQQDTFAAVADKSVTLTGSPSGPSYSWALIDPAGDDQVALMGGGGGDPGDVAAHGGWTPDLPGNWVEECTVTVGSDVQVVTRTVQVGDDEGFVYLDLSTDGTATDPNNVLDAGSSSLGVTSTLVADTNHGSIDAGLDPYVRALNVQTYRPATARMLVTRVKIATPATTGPSAGACGIGCYVGTSATPASTEGYHCDFIINNLDQLRYRSSVERLGSATSGASAASGALVADMVVTFRGLAPEAPQSAVSQLMGSSSGLIIDESTAHAAGTWTDIFAGIYLSQENATPGAKVTWTGVKVGWKWA
jgi:hypothetical protein